MANNSNNGTVSQENRCWSFSMVLSSTSNNEHLQRCDHREKEIIGGLRTRWWFLPAPHFQFSLSPLSSGPCKIFSHCCPLTFNVLSQDLFLGIIFSTNVVLFLWMHPLNLNLSKTLHFQFSVSLHCQVAPVKYVSSVARLLLTCSLKIHSCA